MTKKNLILGTASGKLGDMVFYRQGGEQRTRTRVVPKNPKSIKQMTQRLKMVNPQVAFSCFKPIIKSGFTAISARESAFNAFTRDAIKNNPYYITKEQASIPAPICRNLLVAMGSLGLNLQPAVKELKTQGDAMPSKFYNVFDCLLAGGGFQIIPTEGQAGSDAISVLDVEGAYELVKSALPLDVPAKFEITVLKGSKAYEEEKDVIYWEEPYYAIFTFDNGTISVKGVGCSVTEAKKLLAFVGAFRTEAPTVVSAFGVDAGKLTREDALMEDYAIVLSFEDANGLQVSNSRFSTISKRDMHAYNIAMIPWLVGGDIYKEAMQEAGYSTSNGLNAQSLPVSEPLTDNTGDDDGFEE